MMAGFLAAVTRWCCPLVGGHFLVVRGSRTHIRTECTRCGWMSPGVPLHGHDAPAAAAGPRIGQRAPDEGAHASRLT